MKVRELMSEDVIVLNANSPLISAEELMGLRRVRHLPCVEQGRFVGLITHRDLLRAYLPTGSAIERAIHASRTRVREIMHTDVETVTPDTEVTVAAELLRNHKWGCLPVVDADHNLVGIVTDADFLLLARLAIEALHEADPALLDRVRTKLDAIASAET
jgi:CBS domain-containing membrane protein